MSFSKIKTLSQSCFLGGAAACCLLLSGLAVAEEADQPSQTPLINSVSPILQAGNRRYVPSYNWGTWDGDIKAFTVDAAGELGEQVWSAAAQLPVWSSRKIVTWNADLPTAAGVTFSLATMGLTNTANLGSLTTDPVSTQSDLLNFLAGDRSNEGDGKPFRKRSGVPGDFINSNPVLLEGAVNRGYRALPSEQGGSDTRYPDFLVAKAKRTPTLFIGGNEGMLHAFKDTRGATDDGKEVFAYVPKAVYKNLHKLADKNYGTAALCHQFFVDGPLVEADGFVGAPGAKSWRNYLLGSLGAGGRAVFALDVPITEGLESATVRWELSGDTYPDLGYVTAPIAVGVLPNGKWVAIFGNGAFSDARKAVLFVVDLQTGVVERLPVASVGDNGLGGVAVVRNTIGQITTLYAGDLKGNVWKFDYDASPKSEFKVSGGTAFFKAAHVDGGAQPITQAPLIFDHSQGGKIILFGTGVLATPTDANSTAVQAIYGVWDKFNDSVARPTKRYPVLSPPLLATRSLSIIPGSPGETFYALAGVSVGWGAGQRGWVIDLPPGLRVINPSQKVSTQIALVSAIKPDKAATGCEVPTASGLNLLIPVEQGLNPSYPFFDTDSNGVINSSDTVTAGYSTNAEGRPTVIRSQPVCAGGTCTTNITIATPSGEKEAKIEEPDLGPGLKDRVWRRIINPPIR